MFRLSSLRRGLPRLQSLASFGGNTLPMQCGDYFPAFAVKPSMSAARRCSCSHSTRRCSHSRKRGRHSHSRCCSTEEGRGSRTVYLRAKLQNIFEFRLAYGEKKREGAAYGSPSDVFYAFFALRFTLFSEYDRASEGQPRAVARARTRPGGVRIRVNEAAIRIRDADRPKRDAAPIG